MATVLVQV